MTLLHAEFGRWAFGSGADLESFNEVIGSYKFTYLSPYVK